MKYGVLALLFAGAVASAEPERAAVTLAAPTPVADFATWAEGWRGKGAATHYVEHSTLERGGGGHTFDRGVSDAENFAQFMAYQKAFQEHAKARGMDVFDTVEITTAHMEGERAALEALQSDPLVGEVEFLGLVPDDENALYERGEHQPSPFGLVK
jgi:hypothetical protein